MCRDVNGMTEIFDEAVVPVAYSTSLVSDDTMQTMQLLKTASQAPRTPDCPEPLNSSP